MRVSYFLFILNYISDSKMLELDHICLEMLIFMCDVQIRVDY